MSTFYCFRMKLSRIEHIFITHSSWDNVGGLMGEQIFETFWLCIVFYIYDPHCTTVRHTFPSPVHILLICLQDFAWQWSLLVFPRSPSMDHQKWSVFLFLSIKRLYILHYLFLFILYSGIGFCGFCIGMYDCIDFNTI